MRMAVQLRCSMISAQFRFMYFLVLGTKPLNNDMVGYILRSLIEEIQRSASLVESIMGSTTAFRNK